MGEPMASTSTACASAGSARGALFASQRTNGIDVGGSPRGHESSHERDTNQGGRYRSFFANH